MTWHGPMPFETFLEEAVHHPVLIKRFPHLVMPMIDFKLDGDRNMLRKAYRISTAVMEALVVLDLMVLSLGQEEKHPPPVRKRTKRGTRLAIKDLKNYSIVFGGKMFEDWWKAKEREYSSVNRVKPEALTDPFPLLDWAANSVLSLTGGKVFDQKNGADMAFYLIESFLKTNPYGVILDLLKGRKSQLKKAISPDDIEGLQSMVLDFFGKRKVKIIDPVGTRMYLFARTFVYSPNASCEPGTFLATLNLLSQYPIVSLNNYGLEGGTMNTAQTLAISGCEPYTPTLPGDPKCDAHKEYIQKSEEINESLDSSETLFANDLAIRQLKEKEFLLDTMKIIIEYYSKMSRGCCPQHFEKMQSIPDLKEALRSKNYVKKLLKKAEKMSSLVAYSRNGAR